MKSETSDSARDQDYVGSEQYTGKHIGYGGNGDFYMDILSRKGGLTKERNN